MEFTKIYKVDLKWVAQFYQENKSKMTKCEDFCFYIEELEGKEKYLVFDDIFKD